MFDPGLFSTNLAVCAVAAGLGAFAREGRRSALGIGALLVVNYVFCALAYTPLAPRLALEAVGVVVSSKDLWMVVDAMLGAAALSVAFNRWWGWAIWVACALQVATHITYQLWPYDEFVYSDRLRFLLHVQQAILFAVGGPGAVDYMRGHLDRLRPGRFGLARSATE